MTDPGMDGARWTTGATFLGTVLTTTCCALPSLLVALGLGGAVASVVSAVPGVTFLSAHKAWVFGPVGVLLGLSWAASTGRLPTTWARTLACPTGGAPRNVRLLWRVSAALYAVSLAVVYLGAPVARLLWR
ncbi:MAG: hypothetical protein ACREKI_06100 [Gemmatimonadota bacterium]